MAIQDVKQAYLATEWADRENYYAAECGKISIPSEPTPRDIMRITSLIDAILTEALLDMAYVKRSYLDYKNKMNLAEKEAFVTLKQSRMQPTGSGAPVKLTENDVKGLVVQYLKNNPIKGLKHDIYTLVQNVEYRLTFIEAVVKILTEKKAALISDNAMLKIEAGINTNMP